MAITARQFDFNKLLDKFIADQGINSPEVNAAITAFGNYHKENVVLVLTELQSHVSILQGEASC